MSYSNALKIGGVLVLAAIGVVAAVKAYHEKEAASEEKLKPLQTLAMKVMLNKLLVEISELIVSKQVMPDDDLFIRVRVFRDLAKADYVDLSHLDLCMLVQEAQGILSTLKSMP
jgi:hypothetical protein